MISNHFTDFLSRCVAAGKELWAVVSSSLALARQNPTPFVSAVRIVEREEALDQALLAERGGGGRPLPAGRPRCWKACFFQVSLQTQVYITNLHPVKSPTSSTSGTRGGGLCAISQRFLSAHARPGFGGPPLCPPARRHG